MENRVLKGKQSILGEGVNQMDLEYYLINDKRFYLIEIVKRSGNKIDSEKTFPISDSKDKAEKIIFKLYNNKVTPMCLLETVDDLI